MGTFPLCIFVAAGICVMDAAGITKNTILDAAVTCLQENLGYQAVQSCMPVLVYDAKDSEEKTIYDYLAANMDEMLPIYGYAREQEMQMAMGDAGLPGEAEDSCDSNEDIEALHAQLLEQENEQAAGENVDLQGIREQEQKETQDGQQAAASVDGDKIRKFSRQKLNDFDYLLQNFYRVDSTTTTNSKQLNAEQMLAKDMRIDPDGEGPQILIYHTHSQERFADSKDETQSVVGLGDELARLLEDTYGYKVLHHKGKYDLPPRRPCADQ